MDIPHFVGNQDLAERAFPPALGPYPCADGGRSDGSSESPVFSGLSAGHLVTTPKQSVWVPGGSDLEFQPHNLSIRERREYLEFSV